jgi:hypothetical protein
MTIACPYTRTGACVHVADQEPECEAFTCADCKRTLPACAGGDADAFDPRGELCTECWDKRRQAAAGERVEAGAA